MNNQYSCFFVFTKVWKTSIYSPKLFNIIIYVKSIPALFILQKNKRIHLNQISVHLELQIMFSLYKRIHLFHFTFY